MSENVFDSDQSNATESAEPATTAVEDLLTSIVDESGSPKYRSVEEAIKGLAHAQEHIKKIQTENQTYRSELDKRRTAEEVLEEIKASTTREERPSEQVEPDAIYDLIDKRLEARSQQEVFKRNTDLVNDKLVQKFGEKAKDVVNSKAQEMGISTDTLKKLSAESPIAALALFGFNEQKGDMPVSKPANDVNTETFNPSSGSARWVYWQHMRKNNPREYENLTMARHKELEEMGSDKFFGRS